MSHGGALAEVVGWGPFFAVEVHDVDAVAVPPWRAMRELVDDPGVLRQRVAAVGDHLAAASGHCAERVAASVTHLGLVARLISPAMGVAIHSGSFPAVELANLWWQPELGGAFPLSVATTGPVDPAAMVTGAVRELGEAVGVYSVSERVLWGNAASAINGAATMAARARPDLAARASEVASELLDHPLLRHASTVRPDGRFQRRSCCLIYQASAGDRSSALCGDCVLAATP